MYVYQPVSFDRSNKAGVTDVKIARSDPDEKLSGIVLHFLINLSFYFSSIAKTVFKKFVSLSLALFF